MVPHVKGVKGVTKRNGKRNRTVNGKQIERLEGKENQ